MKTGILLITLLLTMSNLASAGSVWLYDQSLETAITNYAYPTVIGDYWTVPPTYIPAWFSDYASSYARGGIAVDGSANFYKMANNHGPKAAFATQVGPDSGASLFQTVWLEAGYRYTLTAAVCTPTRANGTVINKCDAKFALAFAEYPIPGIQTHGLAETTGVIPTMSGVFVDYSVSFTPTASGYYNLALQNRGYVPGTGADNNQSTVFFDNVRLTYCNVPAMDADNDDDVDLADFGVFSACFNGPNQPWAPPPVDQDQCACMDADKDLDIDLADFSAFATCFNGPNQPPACQ